jgi:hypothetical protein
MRVPIVAVALCLAPAVAASQSLGDAARQQARQRATPPQAPKVYTEADLRPLDDTVAGEDPPPPNPAPEDTTKGDEGSATSREASPGPPETEDAVRAQLDRERRERQRRERRWRENARAARARIDAARREHSLVCGPGVLLLTGG